MAERGIDTISYFQVDNPLVQCIDPPFIGFHLSGQSSISSKMVPKAYAEEKVGIFCTQDGKCTVIEYTDIPEKFMHQKTDDGRLLFLSGNIAIHILDRDFVKRLGGDDSDAKLPFHLAKKKIPAVGDDGNVFKPDSPNGVKFEMFVFDALPFAQKAIVVETRREDDFSPVKNAEGQDSLESSVQDQLRQFARWLLGAGVAIDTDETGVPGIAVEISRKFAVDEQSFIENWNALSEKPEIVDGLVIE